MTIKYNYKNKKENGLNETGRPTKYDPKYCQEIIEFFSKPKTRSFLKSELFDKRGKIVKKEYVEKGADLPTISKFAHSVNVNQDTIFEWIKKHNEFSEAIKIVREKYKDFLNDNALQDIYNPIYAKFVAINTTDMRDKTETDVSIKTYEQFKKQKEKYGFAN